jgi:VWFA-related protein
MIRRAFLPLALIAGVSAQAPQTSPNAPDTVIRSSAREVLLDLVVRDAHGKLVTNLKPQDITVFEDGVRQDVRSGRLVAGSEVRAEDEKQAAEAQAATAPVPAPRPTVNPLRTVNVVCLILNDITTVDNDITGSSLIAPTRAFAYKAARTFIDNELRPNTFIGIFTLDAFGLRPVFPFSNDRERLLKAAQMAASNQLPPITVGSAAILNGLSNSMGVNSLITGSAVGSTGDTTDPLGSRTDMRSAAIAGLREAQALKGLVQQLGSLPFQKTVLLLSNGLTRPTDQLEYWDSMIQAATDGGVTFYAVDVHALDPFYDPTALSTATLSYAASLSAQQGATTLQGYTASGDAAVTLNGLASHTMEQAHQDDYVRFAVSSANPQEALRELAERTGGFLIANTNNIDHLLSRVMEEVDTHYEIAYPPKSERDDGHFRKIEVKLARPGLRIETRKGYFAVPDTGQAPTPEEMAGSEIGQSTIPRASRSASAVI